MPSVGMMTTDQVKARLALCKASGCCTVKYDVDKGVASAQEFADSGGAVVFNALQKGRNGPWIVRHSNGRYVKWSDSNNTSPSSTTPG